MTKGEECLYLHTNVFIISRASKGNRIRQEIRIGIIWVLTGRNVMLLNTECMWCFLEKDIVWRHAGQENGELKRGLSSAGENTGRENIALCTKAFTLRRGKGNLKYFNRSR